MSQDARSAFIRNLKKEKATLTKSAKESHVSGSFLDDEEIIKLLNLTEDNKQFPAKISRIRYGIDKNKENYFAFNFVITEGEHAGTAVSQFCGLGGKNKEAKEKAANRLFRYLQALNVNTDQWECSADELMEKLPDEADRITQEKPDLILNLNVWGDDNDRLGIGIATLLSSGTTSKPSTGKASNPSKGSTSPPKAAKSSDDLSEEDMRSLAETADEKGSATCKKLQDEGSKFDLDADDYESWDDYVTAIIEAQSEPSEDPEEESEEEYEDADEDDAINYEDYIGYECDFNADGDVINVTTSAYDESSELFTVVDEDGNEYETEFANLDFGNGFGMPTEE